MTVNDRIQGIVDCLYSGNKRAFSQAIGVSPAVIENIVGKRQSNPSYDVTYKILSSIDNISSDWLIKGKGEMLTQSSESVSEENTDTRPRIPLQAAAGSLTTSENGVTILECEQLPIITALPSYDFTILAHGDSMSPEYHSGDELACLLVNSKSFIQWGRVHILDTAQGIVVKKIFDGGNDIICRSTNPTYTEFKIPKTDIYHIALVVGLVRRY